MKSLINKVSNRIQQESSFSKKRSMEFGEVFTSSQLINEMLDLYPREIWEDKDKTWFDPCAGKGNFPILIIKRLFIHLQEHIPDEQERLKHIIEKQLYMAEYQRESADFIDLILSFGGRYKVNLYVGDTLNMPDDFFDLSWEERQRKYPDYVVT